MSTNCIWTLQLSMYILRTFGFLIPPELDGSRSLYTQYSWVFWFTVVVVNIVIAQAGAMFDIWGDIALMTSTSCLLFTELVLAVKIINSVVYKMPMLDLIQESDDELVSETREEGIEIVKRCDRVATILFIPYVLLASSTVLGWAASAEKKQLPFRAWYPYNTTVSPAYEITYINQILPLSISAGMNICLDVLATSTIAVCRCRLRLVALSLRTLCDGLNDEQKAMLSPAKEEIVYSRFCKVVRKHESALKAAQTIQKYFTKPVLAQFSVSIVIVCVTIYQLVLELKNGQWLRILPMVTYLLVMSLQVFFYCLQGHLLTEESADITDAVYECPWYSCSVRMRKLFLIVMVRTRRQTMLTAGGFTSFSLSSFTAIIKASYTFFTVLKQVDDRNRL